MIAGRIWSGDILVADIEELEKLDASETHPVRLNAQEDLISQMWQVVQQNYQDGNTNSKNPP